uniref:Flavonol synthase n=1 Tax=Fagopyrum tataricum TaxID=62330 RepID=A0A3G2BZ47_FAGTA|nr:flavonol synthase [Fagopyrum tataricum]
MVNFRWAKDATAPSLSSKYIISDDKRPRLSEVVHSDSIPIIDMNKELNDVVQQVAQASQEYGFFQIINHGVSDNLYKKAMEVVTEFFHLPPEEKARFSEGLVKGMKVFGYYLKEQTGDPEMHMWSEIVSHLWHPSDPTFTRPLPQNPPQYREVMEAYSKEIEELFTRILGLLSLGLGLEETVLKKSIGESPTRRLQVNYYPPCPNPELTLGLAVHTDYQALTIVQPSDHVPGFQVLKDGKWIAVDPIPNSYVINIGDIIQIMSNGKYKSVYHRAVTNKDETRVSMGFFYGPNDNGVVRPLKEMIDDGKPPLYREFLFKEYVEEFGRRKGKEKRLLEFFEAN